MSAKEIKKEEKVIVSETHILIPVFPLSIELVKFLLDKAKQ
jgi:hypothetical protein